MASSICDIPTPAGFDSAGLETNDLIRDRYQLGAEIAGAVACAWVGQWDTALASGDHAKR